jgi:hypothetical protein
MALPSKSLDQITEADLLALVQAGEAESKVIEYKETLPGNTDSDKKEFLFDVSSFANTAGGTLVYGMKAKDGVPVELTGIVALNSDAEKLRLHAIIQNGLQPRIPTAEIEAVTCANGNKALLIKIQRSWSSPHMVTFKGGSKFYSRHSNGKYQLDVSELRAAFLASETVSEKQAAFRADRLSKIINNEIPVLIKESARLVLHLLPLSSFSPGYSVDVKKIRNRSGFEPMHVAHSYGSQYNFDGCYVFESFPDNSSVCYTQVFRSGCIEIVDSFSLQVRNNSKILYAKAFQRELTEYLPKIFSLETLLGTAPPIMIALSLLNVRDYNMSSDGRWISAMGAQPIDRDHLLMPGILLEDFDCNINTLLKPAFDAIYNACGYAES